MCRLIVITKNVRPEYFSNMLKRFSKKVSVHWTVENANYRAGVLAFETFDCILSVRRTNLYVESVSFTYESKAVAVKCACLGWVVGGLTTA